jgi:hypothetical protein
METMRILNRFGLWEFMEWDFNPDKNLDAKQKATSKLFILGITNATITEVAPLCFWYSVPEEKINCGSYWNLL